MEQCLTFTALAGECVVVVSGGPISADQAELLVLTRRRTLLPLVLAELAITAGRRQVIVSCNRGGQVRSAPLLQGDARSSCPVTGEDGVSFSLAARRWGGGEGGGKGGRWRRLSEDVPGDLCGRSGGHWTVQLRSHRHGPGGTSVTSRPQPHHSHGHSHRQLIGTNS